MSDIGIDQYMARHGQINYARQAKRWFLLGAALLLFGIAGEVVGHVLLGDIPAWEDRLFVYAEGTGIVVGFLAVFLFGFLLPLTE